MADYQCPVCGYIKEDQDEAPHCSGTFIATELRFSMLRVDLDTRHLPAKMEKINPEEEGW